MRGEIVYVVVKVTEADYYGATSIREDVESFIDVKLALGKVEELSLVTVQPCMAYFDFVVEVRETYSWG